ncbi:MAG: FAD/NAD(P)-binding protein [Actinomycetales bacterium]|nr:FAD/NAD(P)-binding protein [Actinomycetales bacterium]
MRGIPPRVRVGIVGGGASGTLVAIRLLRDTSHPIDLTVFEPRERLGEGIAYSTDDPHHLLNVPARGMSAFVEDPDDFRRWAGAEAPAFVPRARYADYLRSLLGEAVAAAPVGSVCTHVRERITDLGYAPSPWVVTEQGHSWTLDHLVLATGNGSPAVPEPLLAAGLPASRIVPDPWRAGALDVIAEGDRLLLVGSGLTAVDVAVGLAARVRGVRFEMLSRRGLVPASHDDPWQPGSETPGWDTAATSPRDVLRYLRASGEGWRQALDGLRPMTAELWQAWDDRTKEAFQRHLMRYWDVHRHRMAPSVAVAFDRLVRAGYVRRHTASLEFANDAAAGIRVRLGRRSRGRWAPADGHRGDRDQRRRPRCPGRGRPMVRGNQVRRLRMHECDHVSSRRGAGLRSRLARQVRHAIGPVQPRGQHAVAGLAA